MTDIMRICPHDQWIGYFLLAYLLTDTAQALIRRGRTGTTVDHLAPSELLGIPVVWPPEEVRDRVSSLMRDAEASLDRARKRLDSLEHELHENLGLPLRMRRATYINQNVRAFSVPLHRISTRIDAASYDPRISLCTHLLKDAGSAELGDMAELRMLGR
jgi:hypothetical protein